MATEKRVTVSLPKDISDTLDAIAKDEGCTVSWLIRRFAKQGIEVYMKEGGKL